jgi:hypothetical protein
LVVVGASDERVDAVAAKLTDAARSFLGLELAVVARLPKLDRVESSARVTYPAAETPPFEEFMAALTRARAGASQRFDDQSNGSSPALADQLSMPSITSPTAPTHVAQAFPANGASAGGTAQAPARAAPPRASALPPSGGAPQRLVPYLRGLRPLGIACPTVPDVELALDEAGRLQIVGRSDQLARVRAAHNWARQHQQLLGLAFPELAKQFTVLERLLINDAREAIGLHGTGVLLDLLVQVETPAGPVNAVVALNDAATAG